MSKHVLRKHVSMPGLLSTVRKVFNAIPDPVNNRGFTLTDCLMSGLAMFHLKSPSLLDFDQRTRGKDADPTVVHNLKSLFKVKQTPSDSSLRKRLDPVDPKHLRDAFKEVFTSLQRSKGLEHFTDYEGHYLLSLDGTGFYSSSKVHCPSCLVKNHKNGTQSYSHQMLGGALVHPDSKIVIPLAPEMITKQDGVEKNDCERNASKRFITAFRQDHPHLKTIVIEDALASNGPHIKHLQKHDLRFILGAKPDDHKLLFDWVDTHPDTQTMTRRERTKKGVITRQFRWLNDVPLNDANFNLEVNVLMFTETKPGRKGEEPITTKWTWATDLPLNETSVIPIMRAARARWRVENELFQTLKKSDGGYRLEHSYGHGHHNLASVMAHLCLLTFLLDQVVEHSCGLFQQALQKKKRKKYLWEAMRMLFSLVKINSWETFYRLLIEPRQMIEGELLLGDP